MRRFSTYSTVMTALFAALICVATMIIRIPIPATGGYANLGDGILLVCAFMMHPLYAVTAAGLGSMLADILSGYASYAPATLIIKALMALAASLIYTGLSRKTFSLKSLPRLLLAAFAAEAVMILGYFFYEAVILGMGMAAAAGILGNVSQGAVGILAAAILVPLLSRSHELDRMMERTWQ